MGSKTSLLYYQGDGIRMANATAYNLSESHKDSFSKNEIGPLMNYLFLPLMMSLLFVEAVREFIGQIYFQNLSVMSLGPSILLVFLLLSPVIVVILRRLQAESLLMISGIGVVLFRFIMPFVQAISTLYMLIAGLVVAFFGIYLPIALSIRFEDVPDSLPSGPVLFSMAFCFAVAIDLMSRTVGATWDLSTGLLGILATPVLCIATALLLYRSYTTRNAISPELPSPRTTSKTKAAVYGLGFGGVLFTVLTFLAYPNVIARWTASSYEIATISIIIALIVYAMLSVHEVGEHLLMRKELILIINLLAVVAAIDLAYLLSPFAGLLAGTSLLAFILDLRLLWGYLESSNANLTDYAIFHFIGMLVLLCLTLFYVLTLVAGMLIPALEGLTPYLILISFMLAVLPSLFAGLSKREVVA
ncbi:MAG: hypothetical protein EAX81_07425 [Candidatus Thorarchaeota archaeon]|nr:hypothetical protein [Candidatus Thorarchaeota archaeon]